MKNLSLPSLLSKYSIEDIEGNIIKKFVDDNNLDYQSSDYLKKYLSAVTLHDEIMNYLSALKHSKLEEIVVDMELLMPSCDKKTNGAFFTPQYIVDYIISTVAPGENAKVIDPSCGSGAFLLGIIRYYISRYGKSVNEIVKENLYGADILDYNTRRSKILIAITGILNNEVVKEENINVITTDSLKHDWPVVFDAVVGNPPYVKFQDLDDITRTFLLNNYQTTKLGTYNLYFAFFELGLKILSSEGKLGYITPNNYFTSLSGKPLRSFFQSHQSIYQIIDFDATKVFDVQTYTAITFMNKKRNECIQYDRIERGENSEEYLQNISLSTNSYEDISVDKWRLLCGVERHNIKALENSGDRLGNIVNIAAGIATLKDAVYFIDPIEEDSKYYFISKPTGDFKIEKELTKSLVKISDMKTDKDIIDNKRRIIFPYSIEKGKAIVLSEDRMKEEYPGCYEYLLSVKDILEGRGKGKHIYSPFYMYGRSQGLNRYGARIYTPTFSLKPRFLLDKTHDGFFTNGYGLYFKQETGVFTNPLSLEENADVLLKIINSSLMDYYVLKTSVAIEGGYPCYQKNFIERFTIPTLTFEQIEELRNMQDSNSIDEYLCKLYQINLLSPNLSS